MGWKLETSKVSSSKVRESTVDRTSGETEPSSASVAVFSSAFDRQALAFVRIQPCSNFKQNSRFTLLFSQMTYIHVCISRLTLRKIEQRQTLSPSRVYARVTEN